ncbi:unnamed protein product [Durusdinium trenchii]|uniref:Uncharacterized protein n=1 Tax=Durusdinium trenchii TaxID=1381693 RepID=A0ABP0R3Q7_9DINO
MTCILPGQGRPQKENMDTRSELFWWTGASFKPLRGMMLTKAALLWGILPGEAVRALQPGRVWHSGRASIRPSGRDAGRRQAARRSLRFALAICAEALIRDHRDLRPERTSRWFVPFNLGGHRSGPAAATQAVGRRRGGVSALMLGVE